jgi:hypothetical protein
VLEFEVPPGNDFYMTRAACSVNAVGVEVELLVDDQPQELQRSYWGLFNLVFEFLTFQAGKRYPAGTVIKMVATHSPSQNRDFTARANGRLYGVLKTL